VQILKRAHGRAGVPSLEDLNAAKLEITQAVSFFSRLSKLPEKALAEKQVKARNLQAHVEFCLKTRKETDDKIEVEVVKADKRKARTLCTTA
jgi:hypothetical protein